MGWLAEHSSPNISLVRSEERPPIFPLPLSQSNLINIVPRVVGQKARDKNSLAVLFREGVVLEEGFAG